MPKEWGVVLHDVSCYSLNNPVWTFLLFPFVSFMQAVELMYKSLCHLSLLIIKDFLIKTKRHCVYIIQKCMNDKY